MWNYFPEIILKYWLIFVPCLSREINKKKEKTISIDVFWYVIQILSLLMHIFVDCIFAKNTILRSEDTCVYKQKFSKNGFFQKISNKFSQKAVD